MNQVKGDVNSNVGPLRREGSIMRGEGSSVEAGDSPGEAGRVGMSPEREQESQLERGERRRESSPRSVEGSPRSVEGSPRSSEGRGEVSPLREEGRGELRRMVEGVVENLVVEGVSIKKECLEEFSELVAQKVFKLKEEKDDQEKVKEARKEGWEEGSEFIICKSCSEHSNSEAIPKDLVKSKRGKGSGFGVISKVKQDGELRARWRLNEAMVGHCELDIHKWCVREAVRVKEIKKTTEEVNREVGITVILTYLKTARRGGSASDFLDNIDFTHLLPGVEKSTQNNSRHSFFDLRADTMEVVDSKVKELFRDKVTEFSCTLDKVTVQRRSFTVLLTFFFMEGRIYCFLNGLISMKEDEYDSGGTGKMVVEKLKASLGMDRFVVSDKLVHFRFESET